MPTPAFAGSRALSLAPSRDGSKRWISRSFFAFRGRARIGLLIGLERGWTTREDAPGSRTAGIRTFAITGLLGGVIGAIAQAGGGPGSVGGGIVLGLGFAAYAAAITIFTRDENLAEKNFSATTAIAAMLTFALGAYALVGDFRVAAAAAVATAGLLALRENIHGWVKNITWVELRSRARAAGDDLHRVAGDPERSDRAVRRRQSARHLADRDRARGRVVPRATAR